ncbi:hypothetical protein CRX72_03555 [Pantoea sp. BRM17]|nr:hypothetical protein CRX72_03555 [Pantoea sp. BRM17]
MIKMNIDTDTQWATWDGILQYYKSNEAYLQSQLGNPNGPDSPNKKYYDPRVWLRAARTELSKISPRFTIAASFGNVHGVYKPGNVKLTPTILRDSQKYVCEKHGLEHNALDFVFHGGSGSSAVHMIDLSEESLEENIEISSKYLARMAKIDMTLEIELGCTGGEEDGVDNSHMDASALYTQPEDVDYA